MKELFSIPYDNYMIDHYGGAEGLEAMVKASGCDGIEWVWGGEPVTREMPKNIVNGYHLTFAEILADELRLLTPCSTVNKICILLTFFSKTSVHSN